MPTFFDNLPVHVLVVHAVVVLVPLAVLGAILVTLWPAVRRRYGWLVVAVAAAATASIPVATNTGEGLERRLPRTALLSAHTRLGDQLLIYAAGMLIALVAFMVVHRRARTLARADGPGTMTAPAALTGSMRIVAGVLAALTIVLAVVSAVQVYRIGDSGARAAWGDRQYVAATQERG